MYVSTIRAHLFLFFHMQIADFLSRWDGMPMGRWVGGWEVGGQKPCERVIFKRRRKRPTERILKASPFRV